jgi:hypothetical protein
MFGLFKKKSPIEVLQQRHQKVLEEAFTLSKVNRSESDKKYQEAEEIAQEIEKLKASYS